MLMKSKEAIDPVKIAALSVGRQIRPPYGHQKMPISLGVAVCQQVARILHLFGQSLIASRHRRVFDRERSAPRDPVFPIEIGRPRGFQQMAVKQPECIGLLPKLPILQPVVASFRFKPLRHSASRALKKAAMPVGIDETLNVRAVPGARFFRDTKGLFDG